MGGDAGIFADIDVLAVDVLDGELAGFEQDGVERDLEVVVVELARSVMVNRAVAPFQGVAFVDADVAFESRGFSLEIDVGAVGEDFTAVVGSDFEARAFQRRLVL